MSSDKPHVLCLMQLPPPVHGASTINSAIAASPDLASAFRLEVIPLRFASTIEDIGELSARKVGATFRVAAQLVRSLRRERPHAVYLTLSPRGGAFYRDCMFVAIVKLFGIPLVYHLHAQGVAAQLGRRWKRRLYAWAFDGVWVFHLAPQLGGDLADLVPPERLLFVENGVEDRYRAGVRRSTNAVPRILFVAHMREDKGPLILLEALGMLKRRGIAFEATFAGAEGTRTCIEAFTDYVEKHGLSERVRWVGPVFGPAKDELFETHDIFAYPTQNDAFPLVVLEAMQWRLPVIASIEGAIPAMLGPDGGTLIAKHATNELADELQHLLRDRCVREQMGDSARARFLKLFTSTHFAKRWEHAMHAVIEASHAPEESC